MYLGLLFLLLVATAQAGIGPSVTQAKLQVRLQNHLTSYTSRPGSQFKCVVISPLEIDGRLLIPTGSVIHGIVRRAFSVHLGFGRERAALDLVFSSYETPDGQRFPLAARLGSIDNSREEVTPKGRIKGVLAASNPGEVLSGIWTMPSWNMLYRPLMGLTGISQELLEKFPIGPVGPAVLLGVRCFLLRFPEPEIHLSPGTDMELLVNMSSTQFADFPASPVPDSPAELTRWLNDQPLGVERPGGQRVEDVINVAFLGSRQELIDGFTASGWYAAEPTTFRSFSRFYFAFNDKRIFATAPVSRLLYRGNAPDLVFEKSLDTVEKRHHVRIWNAGTLNGQEVWLGAATHDTGMRFDTRRFFFTHRIDKNVDDERAKVSVDLSFSGCSEPVSYAPGNGNAAIGKGPGILTDGRIAVLPLQACNPPEYLDADPAPLPPGNKATRLIRRVILESRSYVLRENAYYWAYQAIRYHGKAE